MVLDDEELDDEELDLIEDDVGDGGTYFDDLAFFLGGALELPGNVQYTG